MRDIQSWLSELGLEKYAAAFAEAEVRYSDLASLTNEDLKEIGLPVGPRRRASSAIEAMNASRGTMPVDASMEPTETPRPEENPSVSTDAERRHLTVMFVDLVGSTELATRIDAEDMREVITDYQNTVAGVVSRYEGFVAKFMGDGVLCYFGWPRANEDDAERAVRAGLSIIDTVMKTRAPDGAPLATRIGIATGVVIVGDLIGSGATQEAAVVGETPNLAARLQGIAQPNQLVLPGETRRLLGSTYKLTSIGKQELKGMAAPIEAFVVEGEAVQESRFAARQSGTLAPIVGRDHEIELMLERWSLACSGQGQMLIVSGEAGIGKSRITRAVIDGIATNDHVRMTYQCSPYHADSAFYPVIQQMSFAAGFSAADSVALRLDKLEALLRADADTLRLIAPLMGLDGTERYGALDLTPAQQRAQTMQALISLFLHQARDKPVLLVYEDLHWIDPTSLELLELLLDAIADKPIMVLATARPTFEYGFGGHPIVTRFALNRLGKDQTGTVVSRLTGGKALPDEIIEIIAQRTDGVPLFVEELTKTILESGALKEDGDRLVLDGPLSTIAIPTSLHDSLMARLDRLQPIKEVAQTAACIGREFSHGLLAQISHLPEAELGTALDGLINAELIYRRGLPPEATYLFKHALVRDAAYESLLKEKRRAVHTRILTALEANPDAASEVLALHAEIAGHDKEAAKFWHQAGLLCARQSATKEALGQLDRGIRALNRMHESNERDLLELDIRTDMTGPLVAVVGYGSEKLENNFTNALRLSEQTGQIGGIFPILYGRCVFHHVTAQLPRAVELAAEMLSMARRQDQPEPVLLGHRMMGLTQMFSGELTESLEHLQIATSTDIPQGDRSAPFLYGQDIEAAARCLYSLALSYRGFPEQALAMARSSVERARRVNHPHTLAYTLAFGSFGFADWRRIDVLNWCLKELTQVIQGNPDIQLWPILKQYTEFQILMLTGQPEKALPLIEKYVADMSAARFFVTLPHALSAKADTMIELGETAAALHTAEEALQMARNTGELWHVSGILCVVAKAQQSLGDDAAAGRTLDKAIRLAQDNHYRHFELRAAMQYASLLRDRGASEQARTLLEPIVKWFTEGNDLPDLVEANALLEELGS